MKSSGLRIPAITTEQMRQVDHLMVETYGINLFQMMENAGRNLAELGRTLMGGSVSEQRVIVAVGKGNNGGGGMVAARHLSNWGAAVTVLLENERALTGVPHLQWEALTALPVEKEEGAGALQVLSRSDADLVVDALIGYGLQGNPRGWTAGMIERINAKGVPVISLDVPSGLDATTGAAYAPCVKASATMTLALPKTGLLTPEAKQYVGRLYLADIGVPDALYRQMGLAVGPIFSRASLIALEGGGPLAGQ